MRPRGLLIGTLAATLLLPIVCDRRTDSRLPAEISANPEPTPFVYDRIPFQSRIRPLETTSGRIVKRVTLSVPTRPERQPLNAVYSLPSAPVERVPLVVLLPALAGDHRITDYFAGYLNRRGFAFVLD